MIKKIILIMVVSITILNADFKSIDNQELLKMVQNKVVLIDIRRDDEFDKYGIIKDAHTLTFFDKNGVYDIPKWMKDFVKLVKDKEQPFIIYCAHANRSKVVGDFLSKKLGYKNIYELKGGINYGWIDKGLKTVKLKQKINK